MADVKQSVNKIQVVGTVSEINLKVETKEVTLKSNGTEKKVTCKSISKEDFKNPSISVECNLETENGTKVITVGGSFYPTHEKKLDDKGVVVDNPRFKSLETIMNTYVPKSKVKENEVATRVKMDGSLSANEYATEQGEFKSTTQINIFNCTSNGVPNEDIAEGEITGIIRTIKNEVKGENADETGRLIVELYSFDNQGVATPTNFIVEEDLADDFKDMYNSASSCKLWYEIETKTIGGKKVASNGGFGRRESKMTSGYTITEFSIFKGDEAFEEENELYISLDTMKSAMKTREIMIEQKIKDAKNKKKEPTKEKTSKGLGSKPSKMTETVDDTEISECPF